MSQQIGRPEGRIVPALTAIPLEAREAMREAGFDPADHRRYFRDFAALHEIEVGGTAPARGQAAGRVRVAVWNVERLRHHDAVAATLQRLAPDVALLSEIDKGMARTGNADRLAELAARLGHGYAYGVEFVELDLGDRHERASHAGTSNALGFHGNAVTSRHALLRPFLVRLEAGGGWFGWDRDEPRIGGRMAVGAQIETAGGRITAVSVHVESNSSPDERAAQTSRLLDAIDRYDAAAPVLIGGDFNTSTVARDTDRDREMRCPEIARDPMRLIHVEPFEPLFARMAERGFDWRACNDLAAPTERPTPGRAHRALGKIDWIFTRGLRATGAAVVPALRSDGGPSSDHDCLVVTIEPGP